jgi:hypothetical protein
MHFFFLIRACESDLHPGNVEVGVFVRYESITKCIHKISTYPDLKVFSFKFLCFFPLYKTQFILNSTGIHITYL